MKKILCVFWLSIWLLLGCSNEDSTNKESSGKTIIDSQLKALDKARGVEGILRKSEEKKRQLMDQQ